VGAFISRVDGPDITAGRDTAPAAHRSSGCATNPSVVAEQAAGVAAAWSPEGAPASWRLTAAQFEALRDEPELLEIAATIQPDRLPALLFAAAAAYLVLELEPRPLREWFPRIGAPQPALGEGFRDAYRRFCVEHRERLLELCARHRYQMNEVGRCADLLPAVTMATAGDRELALVDIGTGAGLALHLDRYRYVFAHSDGGEITVGDPGSEVVITTEVRGTAHIPLPDQPPRVGRRIGIDIEPLDLENAEVRAWLAACIPQEIGAVTRFHQATRVARSRPAELRRGDALSVLPQVLAEIPDEVLICLTDSYVHVFFDEHELRRFREFVDAVGAERDIDWISVDPLVPLGPSATRSVVGVPVPPALIDRNRARGVFGVLGRVSHRAGRRSAGLLGIAHPGAAWLEWLDPATP
jgi:hypothetical protein